MAEALLNHHGAERIKAVSAGSNPTGQVHPLSLYTLEANGLPAIGYYSKSWDVFAEVPFDAVITVCDNAAGEICPVFFGSPVKAHWGVPDPAHAEGTAAEVQAVFQALYAMLEKRVQALLAIEFEGMDKHTLMQHLNRIGSL